MPYYGITLADLGFRVKSVADGWAWRAMKWAWKEYRVARLFGNENRMIEEAFRIRTLEDKVGITLSAFQELHVSWPPVHGAEGIAD